ncbi:MAG: hypothetical protein RSE41_00520 [Clostridia bacterium]
MNAIVNSPKVTDLRKQIYNQVSDTINNLYCRWSCEKEYEDFKDYETLLRNEFNKLNKKELTFEKATKRPFGIKYNMNINGIEIKMHLYVKTKGDYLQFLTKIGK